MSDDAPDSEYQYECPECGAEFDTSHTTINTNKRWKYTGTIVTSIVVLSLPILIILAGLGVVSLAAISQAWLVLYGTVTLMASTWLYGKETLEAVQDARNG